MNMQHVYYRSVIACAVVAALFVSPALAQSKASAKSIDALGSVIKEVTAIRGQVQGAMDSLNALTSGDPKNLSKNYKAFSKNVEDMAKSQQTTAARAEDFKTRRDAYLAEWQKQMQEVSNPDIQALMQTREEAVKATFETLQPAAQAARDAFPPFLSDLQDIQKLLSVDLSPSGVAAAGPVGQKAVANGTTVLQNIDAVLATLNKIEAAVSPKTT
jgi:DUF2959 family protein